MPDDLPPPPPGGGQPPVDPRGTLHPAQPGAGSPAPQGPRPPMPTAPPPGFYPPPPPPPMPMFYPPPRRSHALRNTLLTLAGLVAFVGLCVVVLVLVVGALTPGGGGGAGGVVTSTLSGGQRGQTIAVIPVEGLIVDATEQRFRRQLDKAAADKNVKAVVLHVSTPGGTVTDSHEMYDALLKFKAKKDVPVYVHMNDVAASGGYFLACAADKIFAQETTITGSIGVLIQYPQLAGFAEKTGIKLETIVADGSPKKNSLDSFERPDEGDLSDIKTLLNSQYDLFRRVVETGRGSQIAAAGASLDTAASGAVFLGPEALALGLVDQIGFLDDTLAAIATDAKLSDPRVVRYDRPPTLLEELGFAASASPGVSINGESAKSLAVELLHEASSPRMLYLYQGAR